MSQSLPSGLLWLRSEYCCELSQCSMVLGNEWSRACWVIGAVTPSFPFTVCFPSLYLAVELVGVVREPVLAFAHAECPMQYINAITKTLGLPHLLVVLALLRTYVVSRSFTECAHPVGRTSPRVDWRQRRFCNTPRRCCDRGAFCRKCWRTKRHVSSQVGSPIFLLQM